MLSFSTQQVQKATRTSIFHRGATKASEKVNISYISMHILTGRFKTRVSRDIAPRHFILFQ